MYAGVNPNPDAQHALVFAADFLRDHGPEPTVQNPHSAGDQNGYWLVELRPAFDGHPAFDPTYYAGWMDGPSDAAKTHDVHASAKFTSKEAAQQVAAKLGHTLSCAWEAVEHKCEADRSPERDAAAVRAWAIENFSPDVMDVAVDAYNAGTVGAAKTAFKRTQ
jgi:hypothetical protein